MAAPLPGWTLWTSSPFDTGSRKTRARSRVIGVALIPMNARSTWPSRISCAITVLTVFDGIAKPTPTLPPLP